jgi:hypothetical protein
MSSPLKTIWVAAWVMALVACTSLAEGDLSDFKKFVDDRDACEHFGGEVPDPPDPERMKEIVEQMNIYCTGTDARLAALKAKHAKNAEMMSKLNEYEDRIERIRP